MQNKCDNCQKETNTVYLSNGKWICWECKDDDENKEKEKV